MDIIEFPSQPPRGKYARLLLLLLSFPILAILLPFWIIVIFFPLIVMINIFLIEKQDSLIIIKGIGILINSNFYKNEHIEEVLLLERASRMSFIYVLSFKTRRRCGAGGEHFIKRPLKDLLLIRKEIQQQQQQSTKTS